jgi:flagellar biosynthetic protein FliR
MPATFPGWICGCLLLALRIAPVFAAAPPFTLVRLPVTFRVLLAIGLAATIVSYRPEILARLDLGVAALLLASARELMLGIIFVLVFQLAFGAIYVAGRTVDIQAGFGLSLLIDPTSGASTPLIGTIFAYLAGMLFFAANGHQELVRILSASLDAVPLGSPQFPTSIAPLLEFLSTIFLVAMGAIGGLVLSLFLVDMTIAMLSRTVPQMNVLVLGFQVKTIVLLVAMPATLGLTAALLARMMRMTLAALPGFLPHG